MSRHVADNLSIQDMNGKQEVVVRCWAPNNRAWLFRWLFQTAIPSLIGREACGRVRLVITDGDSQECEQMDGRRWVRTGSEALFWGGYDETRNHRDGMAYDPQNDTWRTIPEAPLDTDHPAVSVWTGEELILWGGGRPGEPSATRGPPTTRRRTRGEYRRRARGATPPGAPGRAARCTCSART